MDAAATRRDSEESWESWDSAEIRQQSGPIVGPEKCENAGRANCIYGSARSQISSAAHTLSTLAQSNKKKKKENRTKRKKERKFYERAGARTAAAAATALVVVAVVVAADAVTVLLLLRFELSPGATLGHVSNASRHGKYLHRPRPCIPSPAQP